MQILRSIAYLFSLAFAVVIPVSQATAFDCAAERDRVAWKIPEEEELASDPGVRLQVTLFGKMLDLELIEIQMERMYLGTNYWPMRTSIVPLYSDNGIIIIEREFETRIGQMDAKILVDSICNISESRKTMFHGWQASYSNQVLSGSYNIIPVGQP